MDGSRFDALARLAIQPGSRRHLLARLLAGSGLAVVLGSDWLTLEASAATDRQCRHRKAVSNERCPGEAQCKTIGDQLCCCARTAEGDIRFVDLRDEDCPTSDECDRSKDCPGHQICIQVAACCEGSRRNLCVRRCDVNATATAASESVTSPLLGG